MGHLALLSRAVDDDYLHMITLSKLNGERMAVNAELIESAEAVPDTIVRLVDGTSYVVAESVAEVVARVFRASLLARKRMSQAR
jgi:flagellar protein FlbD